MNNSEDSLSYKSASGYGKYTDTEAESTNRQSSVRITPITEERFNNYHSSNTMNDHTSSKDKPKSRPPRPPPKPLHLRTKIHNTRCSSNLQSRKPPMERISSEATETIVDVNVDELEADFRKRFPSKV